MHDTPLTPKVSKAVWGVSCIVNETSWGVLHVQPEVHLAYNAPLTPKVSDMGNERSVGGVGVSKNERSVRGDAVEFTTCTPTASLTSTCSSVAQFCTPYRLVHPMTFKSSSTPFECYANSLVHTVTFFCIRAPPHHLGASPVLYTSTPCHS